MKEELGIDVESVRLLRPAMLFRKRYSFDGEDYIDNEFIACYGAEISLDKPLRVDENEVSKIKWVERDWIALQLSSHPEKYTPWFQDERLYI